VSLVTTSDASQTPVDDTDVAQDMRPGLRFGTVALALALVVGLLLGYASGLLTPSLRNPGDTSAEAGFARDMSTHHAQAVEMGMIAFQKATDSEVRGLGYDIALTQENQIGQMQTWLKHWGLGPTGPDAAMAWMPEGTSALVDGRMPGMASDDQLNQLRAATGKNVDTIFLRLMIQHHLGGIHMIEGILAKTDRSEVRDLAVAMKNGQQGEITVLRSIQARLGVS
jgi:uncharacterized protein (DUF305 family)